ncbi:Membrane-bound lytic murein transglycosylase C precursor [hydrothermal vent metagenome]|uniref:Membrane-bound lytic murein transglycosylase C n=1 Tax=hydrothermal vent metagenome TaxID=652676 RepID=A0A1W1CLN9_9ZZZZ
MKSLLLCLLLFSAAEALTFEEYKQQTHKSFIQSKKGFQAYKAEQKKAFENYVKELQKYWKKPILTDKKSLVSYSNDKKSRTIIDFKHNKLTIQTLAKNRSQAKQKLKLALAKAVTFDTKDFYKHDALEQKFAKIEKQRGFVSAKVDTAPVLAPVLFQKKPTRKSLFQYVNKTVQNSPIKQKNSSKLHNRKLYTLSIQLPKDTTIKRSRIYYEKVQKEANRQQLPLALIFAIIHSESSFNPMARSYIPAYGLMQIVPHTAGIDAYYYLYKRKKLVGSSYLYNAGNNIKMGSAYLHLLYYNYLKDIKNPQSRLYCTIAAYNTGAGNVARAFVSSTNTHRAALIINKLSPKEVYRRLLQDLHYEEPKRYLIKVNKRMKVYKNIYG